MTIIRLDVFSAPENGTHEDLLPGNPRLLPAGSHLRLIQVTPRGVDMAISHAQGGLDCIFDLVGFREL